MDPKSILALFGLDIDSLEGEPLSSGERDGNVLFAILKDDRKRCPFCGSEEINIHDWRMVRIKHGEMNGHPIVVNLQKRRYKCMGCGKIFTQETPVSCKRKTISRDTTVSIAECLKSYDTFTTIARRFGVSPAHVVYIFDRMSVPGRKPMPRVLSIDEFHFTSWGPDKFPCVITDFIRGDIVDIVRSRTLTVLLGYFSKISLSERQNVRFFVSDMNDTYRQVHDLFFPKSIEIVDTFHITELFTALLQKLRIRHMKEVDQKSYEYQFMKTNWSRFLCRSSRVIDREIYHKKDGEYTTTRKMIMLCLEGSHDFLEAYNLKEDFLKYSKGMSESDASKFIDWFIKRAESSTCAETARLGRTLRKWRGPIVNGFMANDLGINITNSKAERINGKIRGLLKAANGYSNFERLRRRIIYIDRNRQ